jgi:hypothetical protein
VHNKELHDFDDMKSWIRRAGRMGRCKVSVGMWRCGHTIILTGTLEQQDTKVAVDTDKWTVHCYSVTELRVPQKAVKFLTS